MTGFQEPNLTNIPKPGKIPDWSCKQWGFPKHEWLSCMSCQTVYEAHLEAEKRGEPGILHWFREDIQEATACGSRSKATTPHIKNFPIDANGAINGKMYTNPKVTCPLCIDIALDEGTLIKPAFHETPAPEAHFDS